MHRHRCRVADPLPDRAYTTTKHNTSSKYNKNYSLFSFVTRFFPVWSLGHLILCECDLVSDLRSRFTLDLFFYATFCVVFLEVSTYVTDF